MKCNGFPIMSEIDIIQLDADEDKFRKDYHWHSFKRSLMSNVSLASFLGVLSHMVVSAFEAVSGADVSAAAEAANAADATNNAAGNVVPPADISQTASFTKEPLSWAAENWQQGAVYAGVGGLGVVSTYVAEKENTFLSAIRDAHVAERHAQALQEQQQHQQELVHELKHEIKDGIKQAVSEKAKDVGVDDETPSPLVTACTSTVPPLPEEQHTWLGRAFAKRVGDFSNIIEIGV